MNKRFLNIDKVPVYTNSNNLSNYVWKIVTSWNILSKKTVGEQLIKSIDSISANIAEGFGRYFRKDKVKFYYYARGSVIESLNWIDKAYKRNLLSTKQYELIKKELESIPFEINSLIKLTMRKLKY